jgi:predicted RNA-binding protein
MCQAAVYLDKKEIMRDVMLLEPIPEGIRLVALFEPVQVIPATIRQIDLMKHQIFLESLKGDEIHERITTNEGADSALG